MDLKSHFEFPLPILSVDKDTINIETTDLFEDEINIKNTGGSLLEGKIYSHARSVSFEPSEWQCNDLNIKCFFAGINNPDGLRQGDYFSTTAVIVSNGGEKIININIKLTKMIINTAEGPTITNLADFYSYSRQYPVKARRLFIESEFCMLLIANNYPYLEAYDMLIKDMNRERAIDNFFILSGLKEQTFFTLTHKRLEFNKKTNDNSMVYGNFLVHKNNDGFFEAGITIKNKSPWLTLASDRLITSDFNEANTAMVKFSIDPLLVSGMYARAVLLIDAPAGDENSVEITFRRLNPLKAHVNKNAFKYEDEGIIHIKNQSGDDMNIDLFCKENFVIFEASRYFVGDEYKIPFKIKVSKLQSIQMSMRRFPYVASEIDIKTILNGKLIRTKLPIKIGGFV